MVSVDGLAVEFGGTTLFSDISFQINEKDRIALMGKNGAGKSTLLKILAGVRQPTRGRVTAPKDCVIAYLPQHLMTEDGRTVFEEASMAFSHLKEMEREIEVLNNELATRTDYESEDYMALIEKVATMSEKFYAIDLTHFEEDVEKALLGLGFERSDFTRPTSDFSGGWRMRIELAKLLLQDPDVLLLDEPTNHLDIAAREWIEEAVEAFDGTLLFVSHDRYFIQRFATRIWELADGTITDYPMGFAQYRAVKAQEKAPQPVKAPEKKGDTRPPRGNRSQQAARRQLTICETGISKLEAECRRLDEEMAAHACDAGELNRLYQEKQEVEARLEQEMARWEELSLQIEE